MFKVGDKVYANASLSDLINLGIPDEHARTFIDAEHFTVSYNVGNYSGCYIDTKYVWDILNKYLKKYYDKGYVKNFMDELQEAF